MMLARALAFDKLERYKEAEEMYRNILDIYGNNKKARQGLRSVRLKQMRYSATVSYRRDQFSGDFESWNIWQFELSRETKYGTIQGDVQQANMFNKNGVQFNINAYPTIYEGLFAHVNIGYSGSEIFPQYRYGVSLFKSLPADYELEAGIRRLEFSSNSINIYTFALSRYWRSYLFTARSYLVPSANGSSQSITVLARRYFADPSIYVSLMGGYGTGSGNIQFQEEINREKLWLASIKAQHPLGDRIYLGGEIGFESEEFPNFKRDRFRVRMLLTYRF
jgi:YaiO family outer membrane protein